MRLALFAALCAAALLAAADASRLGDTRLGRRNEQGLGATDSINAGLDLSDHMRGRARRAEAEAEAEVNDGGLASNRMDKRAMMTTEEGALVTESVHLRKGGPTGQEQDRTWDTPENGGTTVVLQNLNSLEAHVDRSKAKKAEEEHLKREQRNEQLRAQEQKLKSDNAAQRANDEKRDVEIRNSDEQAEKRKAKAEAERNAKKVAEEAEKSKQIKLSADFRSFEGFSPVEVKRFGTLCVVTGVVRGESRPGVFAVMPDMCKPTGRIMFAQLGDGYSARVDVKADGELHWVAGTNGRFWLTLGGMIYTVSDQISLNLRNGWAPFGEAEWRPPGVRVQGDLCVVSGLVKNSDWKAHIANVPAQCNPEARLIFSGSNHNRISRLDVAANGAIVHSGGASAWGWVSLDGIAYVNKAGKDLTLAMGWSNYGHGYRGGQYHKIDNLCLISGLVTFAQSEFGFHRHIATVPEECRPKQTLMFGCNLHEQQGRCEVRADGHVRFMGDEPRHKWVSLAGIVYLV